MRFAAYLLSFLLTTALYAHACPLVNNFPNINCDTQINALTAAIEPKLRFAGIGDSTMAGRGDVNNQGGWLMRLGSAYPDSQIVNLGIGGANTLRIFRLMKRPEYRHQYEDADIIFLVAGLNDYWISPRPAVIQVRNRLIDIKRYVSAHSSAKVYIGKLSPSRKVVRNRIPQQQYIDAINLKLSGFASFDFSKMSSALIPRNDVHPTPAGYDAMYHIVQSFLNRLVPRLMRSCTCPQ